MAGVDSVSLSALLGGADRVEQATDAEDDDAAPIAPRAVANALIEAGQRLDARGWVPATAGNLSQRLPDGRIAITRSGCHKGFLTTADIMLVDEVGAALTPDRPSAETLLHCQIYRLCPTAGAVLHGHSVAATVLSRRAAGAIRLADYEVLKAFAGVRSHQVSIDVPVFPNDQDIARLAATIAPAFAAGLPAGYIIAGHGVYAWGEDLPTALARLEALEFLLACALEEEKLK